MGIFPERYMWRGFTSPGDGRSPHISYLALSLRKEYGVVWGMQPNRCAVCVPILAPHMLGNVCSMLKRVHMQHAPTKVYSTPPNHWATLLAGELAASDVYLAVIVRIVTASDIRAWGGVALMWILFRFDATSARLSLWPVGDQHQKVCFGKYRRMQVTEAKISSA